MILLKSISLRNFLSHSDTKIDFSSTERVLIDGKSGAGKSSIIEALIFALYNRGRVQNRSLIKRGKNNMAVTVELADDQTIYKITRDTTLAKKGGVAVNEVRIWKNNIPVEVSGSRAIQNYIENQVLRCSYILFINSCCYLQENLESFARQAPSVRKDILLELVHSQDYDTYYEKTRQAINGLETKLTVNLTKTEALLAEILRSQALIEDLPATEAGLKEVESMLRDVEKKLAEVHAKEVEIARLRAEIASINTRLSDFAQSIIKVQRMKKESEKLIKELQNVDPIELKVKFEEAQVLRKELTEWENKANRRWDWQVKYTELSNKRPVIKDYSALITETQNELEKLATVKISEEKCPHCGTVFPCHLIVEEHAKRTERLTAMMVDYLKKQSEGQAQLDAHSLAMVEIKNHEVQVDEVKMSVLKLQLSKLEPYIEKFYSAQNREALIGQQQQLVIQHNKTLEQYGLEREATRQALEAKEQELKQYGTLKADKTLLLQLQQEHQTIYGELSETLALAKAAQARKQTIGEELAQFATEDQQWKTRMENLQLLKEALGQNGIRAIVLDYVIPQLEDRINAVLGSLSSFSIRLDTQRTNVTGESQIEGLFISIVNENGEEFDYDNYSGGQKIKILFAISEGLAELQKIGFRILDEAVIGLDVETGQQFAEAIMAFQSHYSQLLCISHVREIKDLFEKVVTVINLNGDSKIMVT